MDLSGQRLNTASGYLTRLSLTWCKLLLFCCLATIPSSLAIQTFASNSNQFFLALQNDTTTRIVINTTYLNLKRDALSALGVVVPIQVRNNRTVVIEGAGPEYPTVDFNYMLRVISVHEGSAVIFKRMLTLKRRYGVGYGFDLFFGSQGGLVKLQDVINTPEVCRPYNVTRLAQTKVPAGYPLDYNNNSVVLDRVCLASQCYDSVMWMRTYAEDVVRSSDDGDYAGRYIIEHVDVYRVCRNFIDENCALRQEADVCAIHVLSALHKQGLTSAGKLAVAVSVSVVSALLLVLGVWYFWRRCSRARPSNEQEFASVKVHNHEAQVEEYSDSFSYKTHNDMGDLLAARAATHRRDVTQNQVFLATTKDGDQFFMQLHATLLGSGSYGQVYKGEWNGQPAAIKVIKHDANSLKRVHEEMNLQMGFCHRNVVRALQCLYRGLPTGGASSSPLISWAGSHQLVPQRLSLSGENSGINSQQLLQQQWSIPDPSWPKPARTSAAQNLSGPAQGTASYNQQQQQSNLQGPPAFQPQKSTVADHRLSAETSEGAAAKQVGLVEQHAAQNPADPVQPQLGRLNISTSPQSSGNQPSGISSGSELVLGPPQLNWPLSPGAPSSAGTNAAPSPSTNSEETSGALSSTVVRAALAVPPAARMPDSVDITETWIIQELCDQGSLAAAIGRQEFHTGARPQMHPILLRLLDISRGMAYIHSKRVCHGDLKGSNVLLATQPTDPYGLIAKVSDFGLSRALVEHQTHLSTRAVGTVSHMPPELLRNGKLAMPADVFAFGVVMWEMATAAKPYAGMYFGEVVDFIVRQNRRLRFPGCVPAPYVQLAEQCWRAQPYERPTFGAIMQVLTHMLSNVDQLQEYVDSSNDTSVAPDRSMTSAVDDEQLQAAAWMATCNQTDASSSAAGGKASYSLPISTFSMSQRTSLDDRQSSNMRTSGPPMPVLEDWKTIHE